MGYRNYIGFMPKREYNKIKSMTKEMVIDFYGKEPDSDGHWYKGVYDYGAALYEFGKYVDFEPPKKSMKPFYKNKELMQCYEEYDFYIVTKEFLAYIISTYKQRVTDYYNAMMMPFLGKRDSIMDNEKPTDFLNSIKTKYRHPENEYEFDFTKITAEEQTSLFKIIEHIRSFRTEWTILTPFNLDKGEEVTTSWKFEYGIFELVRIYKHFDWKKNVMIYYGY
jgi:hypothetical protein